MLHITGETNHTLTLAEHEHSTDNTQDGQPVPVIKQYVVTTHATYEGRAVGLELRII